MAPWAVMSGRVVVEFARHDCTANCVGDGEVDFVFGVDRYRRSVTNRGKFFPATCLTVGLCTDSRAVGTTALLFFRLRKLSPSA